MSLEPGSRLGVYEIRSLLGRGGMGEVYVAFDPRLRRQVALKLVPGELAGDALGLERFRREAESLAQLNHPNIVTIHSVEEDSGTHFLTMELVEGRGLDDLVAAGPLAADSFFSIAIALADAVAAAHERGIVHRDLKPANLIVAHDGRLKVLDFGLAKLANAATSTLDETLPQVTAAGRVLGTAHYMSPEQANGMPVDARSDVFSLGVVLWELAVGARPFDGEGLAAVLYAVVTRQPPPVSATRADLPPALDEILADCLVKEAAARTTTAAEVRDRLTGLAQGQRGVDRRTPPQTVARTETAVAAVPPPATGTEAPRLDGRRPVLAVLPFRAPADADLAAFAEDLRHDVIDGVAVTSEGVVLPADATAGWADRNAREAGRALGAGYVLGGSVRRSGSRLRVSCRLVSTETGTQIWSRHYDVDLGEVDLFAAAERIGAPIVSAVSDVHGVIFEVERQRVEGRPISELGPWECIFTCLGYDKVLDEAHHLRARQALERALELEPGFALAWAYLSWIVTDEVVHGFNALPNALGRAEAAARRAVELDPYSPMVRWLRSRVYFFQGDLDGFRSESRKSLELSSSDATTLGLIGLYTACAGEWQDGTRMIRRAMELNPSHPSYYHFALALDALRRGEYEEALAEQRRLGEVGNASLEALGVSILGHLGRLEQAGAALERIRRLAPDLTADGLRERYARHWNLSEDLLAVIAAGFERAELGGA